MLSIVIPDQPEPLVAAFDQGDFSALYADLHQCNSRSILFYEEVVVGFIVHSSPVAETQGHPDTAYLSVCSTHTGEAVKNPAGSTLSLVSETEPPVHSDVYSAIIQGPTVQGTSSLFSDREWSVTIWKFEAPVGYPKNELGGSITLKASLANPHIHYGHISDDAGETKKEKSSESIPRVSENLFEQLNHGVSRKSASDYTFARPSVSTNGSLRKPSQDTEDVATTSENLVDETAHITLNTSLPLLLKLRSTKAGGRNDVLRTTLSIEASSEMVSVAQQSPDAKYFLHILALEAVFKGGSVTELGKFLFPCRCSINDIINITYKLVSNEYLESQAKNESTGSVTKPLQIMLQVQVEKQDADGTFVCASNKICTMWTPILDFGVSAPPIKHSKKANASHFLTQSQFDLQPNGFRPTLSSGISLRKHVAINSATNVAKPLPHLEVRAPSPNPGRTIHTSASSPLLPVGKGMGQTGKKFPKSAFSSPRNSLTLTFNLASSGHSSLNGLKLVFIGELSVELGKVVTWKVQAINRSGRQVNLSLMVKNSKRPNSMYLHGNNSSAPGQGVSSSNVLATAVDDSAKQNVLVYNRTQLYYQYNLLKLDKGGIVFLMNDVRLGPIEPNQVFESEIKLIGITKGIYNLDGLRVFDMNTGDGIDFGRWLEVFVM